MREVPCFGYWSAWFPVPRWTPSTAPVRERLLAGRRAPNSVRGGSGGGRCPGECGRIEPVGGGEGRDGHRDEADPPQGDPMIGPRDGHGEGGPELRADRVVVVKTGRAGRAVLRLQDGIARCLGSVEERYRHAQRCEHRGGERRDQASTDPLLVSTHGRSVRCRLPGGQWLRIVAYASASMPTGEQLLHPFSVDDALSPPYIARHVLKDTVIEPTY